MIMTLRRTGEPCSFSIRTAWTRVPLYCLGPCVAHSHFERSILNNADDRFP